MTSAHFGTSKIWNCFFLLSASILVKYINFGIHQCSINMVFSLFLGTAYMYYILLPVFSLWVTQILSQNFLRCVQTQKVQITLWCLNFNTVPKGEIQGPPPHFTISSECAMRPGFRKFFHFPLAPLPHLPRDNAPWHQHSHKHGYTTATAAFRVPKYTMLLFHLVINRKTTSRFMITFPTHVSVCWTSLFDAA